VEQAARVDASLSVRIEDRLAVRDATTIVTEESDTGPPRFSTAVEGGDVYAILDLVSADEMLLSRNPPLGVNGFETSAVGVIRGLRFLAFPPAGGRSQPPRRALAGTLTADHAVWFATSTPDAPFSDWAVIAHDRRRMTTRILATSGPSSAGAVVREVPGGIVPVVRAGYAYWVAADTQPSTAGEGKPLIGIQRRRLDGKGPVEVVVQGAKLVVGWAEDLYYVRSADVAPDTAKGRYEIHRWREGRDEVVAAGSLQGDSQVSALAAGPGSISWAVSGADSELPGQLYTLDLAARSATEIVLKAGGGSTSLDYAGTAVVWGNGSGWGDASEYLFDPAAKSLYRIGEQEGSSEVRGARDSRYLMWASAEPSGRIFYRRGLWTGTGF
jgi:hypothetical protein